MADDNCVLIVKHLPADLTREDKEELLKHFGAERVKCFSENGRMKHVTFATFPDHESAKTALHSLHQLDLMGVRLTAEFSNKQFQEFHPSLCDPQSNKIGEQEVSKVDNSHEKEIAKRKKEITKNIHSTSLKWGLAYPSNPKLQYHYPSPTVGILTNIANALASVPKFYVQVLHLMNKMNLPAPFGPVTPTPPIPEGAPPPLPPEMPSYRPAEPEEDMELSSGPESELGSDGDGTLPKRQDVRASQKRPGLAIERPRKKHKLQKIVPVVRLDVDESIPTAKDLFEQPQPAAPKKIELKLPTAISKSLATANIEINPHDQQYRPEQQPETVERYELPPVSRDLAASETERQPEITVEGGFGKLEPVVQEREESSGSDEEEEWGATEFISSRRLSKGRLSSTQMKDFSVFKKYAAGEPTTRLYIKNLAKKTSEKDLHYIFGRYVQWNDEEEKLMFDIRLMKEGRMKGQAFVTLPTEKSAKDAVAETNGFVLHEKPLVVQFARSAKAKETGGAK